MSKRIDVADARCSASLWTISSIETSVSTPSARFAVGRAGPSRTCPATMRSLSCERVAVREAELARELALPPHVVGRRQIARCWPSTPTTRARMSGMTRGGSSDVAARPRLARRRPDRAGCRSARGPARCAPICESNSASRFSLDRADAEHEEAAEADRHQDHARLIARPPEADDRVPQREAPSTARAARRRGRAGGSRRAARAATTPSPTETNRPGAHRIRPARSRRARAPRPSRAPRSQLCQSRVRAVVAVSARSSSSGFTRRISSSGTSAKSSDTSRPTATPWAAADAVTPTRVDAERLEHALRNRAERGHGHARRRATLPPAASHSDLQHVGREHLPRRRAEALEDRDALDLLLDDTRVTLHTPMPPSTTIAKPDEAEVVLGERQVLAEPILDAAPRPHRRPCLRRNARRRLRRERVDRDASSTRSRS